MTHLGYTLAIFVHPSQVPQRERAQLRVRCTLVIFGGLFPTNRFWLVWHTEPVVVIVPDFDQRVNVTLCSGASPLSQRESCSIVGRFNGSEARQTQDASVYRVQTIRQLRRMLIANERTDLGPRHTRGCSGPLLNPSLLRSTI
jgi:hypothetical protein